MPRAIESGRRRRARVAGDGIAQIGDRRQRQSRSQLTPRGGGRPRSRRRRNRRGPRPTGRHTSAARGLDGPEEAGHACRSPLSTSAAAQQRERPRDAGQPLGLDRVELVIAAQQQCDGRRLVPRDEQRLEAAAPAGPRGTRASASIVPTSGVATRRQRLAGAAGVAVGGGSVDDLDVGGELIGVAVGDDVLARVRKHLELFGAAAADVAACRPARCGTRAAGGRRCADRSRASSGSLRSSESSSRWNE